MKRSGFIMIRFSLLLLLSLTAYGDDDITNLEELNSLFQDPGLEMKKSCSGIHGDLSSGCFECYPCDDERLRKFKQKQKKLDLVSNSCDTTTTVCCVEQRLFVTRSSTSCGKQIHGDNRGTEKRTSIRSLLLGEHPWRVWVHRKDGVSSSDILCAATVIDENAWVVMTSASCVHGHAAHELAISFSRKLTGQFDVASVFIHDKYTTSRPHVHDIALLQMNKAGEKPPSWMNSVCLPEFAVMHATTCVTMSDTDCLINPVVPLEENCEKSGVLVNQNQMCAIAAVGDYEPEYGAALICSDSLRMGSDNYIVYGIALKTNGSVTTYTDVYKYQSWIHKIIS